MNSQDARYLILSLAHAQYDGHSLALLHDDVRGAYSTALGARPSYTNVLESALASVGDEALGFWTDTLSGAAIYSFPKNVVK